MNAQEEIQFIVENTEGECWHEWDSDGSYRSSNLPVRCIKCRCMQHVTNAGGKRNPSPHSLDDLVRLAEKNNIRWMSTVAPNGEARVELWVDGCWHMDHRHYADKLADALRSALVKAIEGRN